MPDPPSTDPDTSTEPTEIWLPQPSTIKIWVNGDDVRTDGTTIEFELRTPAKRTGFFNKDDQR